MKGGGGQMGGKGMSMKTSRQYFRNIHISSKHVGFVYDRGCEDNTYTADTLCVLKALQIIPWYVYTIPIPRSVKRVICMPRLQKMSDYLYE